MRETRIEVKLRGWRSDGLVLEPVDCNRHGLIKAIERGEKIMMYVEKGYERSEQDIQNNGSRSAPMDINAGRSIGSGIKLYKRFDPREGWTQIN